MVAAPCMSRKMALDRVAAVPPLAAGAHQLVDALSGDLGHEPETCACCSSHSSTMRSPVGAFDDARALRTSPAGLVGGHHRLAHRPLGVRVASAVFRYTLWAEQRRRKWPMAPSNAPRQALETAR